MRFAALALFLSLPFISPVNAQTEACATIENDLDRLACYDKASGRTPTADTVATESKWVVRLEKSDFKDTTDVYMTVQSDEPVSCGYSGRQEITLFVRCLENTTSVILATHCHVTSGHGGYGQVEYRIDDRKAESRGFNESTNNRSLGLWSGGRAIPFAKKMFDAKRMIVRFTPYGDNPVTASFDISGLKEAITPLREACSW